MCHKRTQIPSSDVTNNLVSSNYVGRKSSKGQNLLTKFVYLLRSRRRQAVEPGNHKAGKQTRGLAGLWEAQAFGPDSYGVSEVHYDLEDPPWGETFYSLQLGDRDDVQYDLPVLDDSRRFFCKRVQ